MSHFEVGMLFFAVQSSWKSAGIVVGAAAYPCSISFIISHYYRHCFVAAAYLCSVSSPQLIHCAQFQAFIYY